jgi:hypothetical protein
MKKWAILLNYLKNKGRLINIFLFILIALIHKLS